MLPQANNFDVVADNLQVQEIFVNDRRYIVCYNPEQAARDAHVRAELINSLETALQQGSRQLIGNKGYRKFVIAENNAIRIDDEKIASEVRYALFLPTLSIAKLILSALEQVKKNQATLVYDGIWILRTNTDLPAADVPLQYKRQTRSAFQLATLSTPTPDFLWSCKGRKLKRKLASWRVEQFFRNTKCMLDTRPIFHQNDKHIDG